MAYNRGKKVPTFDLAFVTVNIWKHIVPVWYITGMILECDPGGNETSPGWHYTKAIAFGFRSYSFCP